MNNFYVFTEFILDLEKFCENRGFSLKTDPDGVFLFPTYRSDGGLGEWFALYIKQNKIDSGEAHG
jgi:hypothetical protein